MNTTVELSLRGEMDHLRIAWQAGETLLGSVPFEDDAKETRYNVLLSMQELLTNVLRHGYRDHGEGPLDVRFETTEEEFSFEIRDRAKAFDPFSQGGTERQQADGMPEEGGYGIIIVRSIMDDVSYRYEDGWNVVRCNKAVRAGATAAMSTEERS